MCPPAHAIPIVDRDLEKNFTHNTTDRTPPGIAALLEVRPQSVKITLYLVEWVNRKINGFETRGQGKQIMQLQLLAPEVISRLRQIFLLHGCDAGLPDGRALGRLRTGGFVMAGYTVAQ